MLYATVLYNVYKYNYITVDYIKYVFQLGHSKPNITD